MKRAYDELQQALIKASAGSPDGSATISTNGQGVSWQEIEAPLFSIRAMGAQVDPHDKESVLPLIMDLLPKLPRHTRIQYAAILVISRYTHWIAEHPEYLPFQLNYISEGFEVTENDVSLAASLAMKFMCQDCKQHLVPYLPQLYSFVTATADAPSLGNTGAVKPDRVQVTLEEKLDIAEAMGYVINSMPESEKASAMQKFTQHLLEQVQAAVQRPGMMSRDDLNPVIGALDQLEAYIVNVKPLETLPADCVATPEAIYSIVEGLLDKYGSSYGIADKATRLLRRGINFYPFDQVQPLIPRLLAKCVACFEGSGHSSYVWLTDRTVALFGDRLAATGEGMGGREAETMVGAAIERLTTSVKGFETQQGAVEIPDGKFLITSVRNDRR